MDLDSEKVNDDRLYRALDRLLPHKTEIERHLVKRLRELIALDYDLLLCDERALRGAGGSEPAGAARLQP